MGFRPFPLTAVDCHGYYTTSVYMSPVAMTYSEYNYPTLSAQVCRLGLPFRQFSLIPHSQPFISPFSNGLIVNQLAAFLTCYTPHWVSPPDKSGDDR